LLELALHWGEGPILSRDVAARQGISLSYLGQLMTPLTSSGLVRGTRGSKGGLQLARHPTEITLSEVFRILEGSPELVECLGNPSVCHRSLGCATRDLWYEMEQAMTGVLEASTLQDLADRHKARGEQHMVMYNI
jgi:Rrf2 family protein